MLSSSRDCLSFLISLDDPLLVLPLQLHGVAFAAKLGKLLVQRGQPLAGGRVLLLGKGLLLDGELEDPPLCPVQLGGLAFDLHLQPAGRLVDQVDGLVRAGTAT